VRARRLQSWRRLSLWGQGALLLLLPFLTVNGESALRFDAASQRLHAFGAALWMDEFFVVLAGTLFLTFAFLLVTLLFGRLWCGFGCPQAALVELTGFLDAARRRGGWRAAAAHGAVALLSLAVAANLTWYFVPPPEFFRRLAALSMGPALGGSWLVLAAVLYADLASWRESFCAGACPYAKLQGALLDRHSLAIAYDARRAADCPDCRACVRGCPVGIDIRGGLQAECTSCARCVDACASIMARLGRRPGLVGYFYGAPGTPRRLARPGVLALGAATAAALALTLGAAAGRSPLDLTVTAAGDFPARRIASGEALLALSVALENRGREPLALALALRAPGVEASLRPDRLVLGAGEHRTLRVVAAVRGLARQPVHAELTAAAEAAPPVRIARELTLSPPGAPP